MIPNSSLSYLLASSFYASSTCLVGRSVLLISRSGTVSGTAVTYSVDSFPMHFLWVSLTDKDARLCLLHRDKRLDRDNGEMYVTFDVCLCFFKAFASYVFERVGSVMGRSLGNTCPTMKLISAYIY